MIIPATKNRTITPIAKGAGHRPAPSSFSTVRELHLLRLRVEFVLCFLGRIFGIGPRIFHILFAFRVRIFHIIAHALVVIVHNNIS
jgi:hypothetical protein